MNVTPEPRFGRPRQGGEPSALRTEKRSDGWRELAFTEQIRQEHDRRREAGRMRLAVLTGVVVGVAGVGLSHLDVIMTLATYIIGRTAS
jgi:hypothetical protein